MILHSSDVTLTVNLETWFENTAHSSLKGSLWLKYETNWKRWIEYICRAVFRCIVELIKGLSSAVGEWMGGRLCVIRH